jgi:hypothetical protein
VSLFDGSDFLSRELPEPLDLGQEVFGLQSEIDVHSGSFIGRVRGGNRVLAGISAVGQGRGRCEN